MAVISEAAFTRAVNVYKYHQLVLQGSLLQSKTCLDAVHQGAVFEI